MFKSKEIMDRFLTLYCPTDIGLEELARDCGVHNCKRCWEYSGVELVIEGESIKMTAENKQFTYTDAVYELIKDMDSIYEDYIVSLVGNCGLAALKRAGLVESCGVLNCRQLYVLVGERSDGTLNEAK